MSDVERQPEPSEKCVHEVFDTGLVTLEGRIYECTKCGGLTT